MINCVQKLIFVTGGDIHCTAGSDSDSSLARRERAFAILSSVRILSLASETGVVPDILESVRGKTSITTVVVIGLSAVNKLLLAQVAVLASIVDHVVSFHGSNSRESPAATA